MCGNRKRTTSQRKISCVPRLLVRLSHIPQKLFWPVNRAEGSMPLRNGAHVLVILARRNGAILL